MHGWLKPSLETPDVKINIIFPATEVHIRKVPNLQFLAGYSTNFSSKYSKQELRMIHESPELYESVVKPYIHAFPAARTQWFVFDIAHHDEV
jgi:m7GpppX diphosphatase